MITCPARTDSRYLYIIYIAQIISIPGWFSLALLLQVVGIGLVIYLLFNDEVNTVENEHIWMIPIAVVCLSVAWMPYVQKFLLKTKFKQQPKQDDLTEDKANTEQASFMGTTQSTSMGYQTISEVSYIAVFIWIKNKRLFYLYCLNEYNLDWLSQLGYYNISKLYQQSYYNISNIY